MGKFDSLQSRALLLLKSHFSASLERAVAMAQLGAHSQPPLQQSSEHLGGGGGVVGATSASSEMRLYVSFRLGAEALKAVTTHLTQRAPHNTECVHVAKFYWRPFAASPV